MSIYVDITIASIFGGTSGGLVYYLTKVYFTEKIKSSIKSEYDNKLENIRGDINRNHTILNTVLTSQNQTFQVGQGERLTAVKTLWSNYLTIRNSLVVVNSIDDVLLETEFNTLYTNQWQGNGLVDKTLKTLSLDKLTELAEAQEVIEAIRPFLNEQIWVNIIYLKTFSGRLIYLYYKGCHERNIKHWKSDTALLELVKDALTHNEFKFISKTNMASIKVFQNFIEQKILTEIHNIITGQVAADNTYNRALQLTNLIKVDK
jgi:hypothetical protein